ncbi:CRISPR-associated helicase/endonuclease Cas3 [Motiliproteus sp. MSK22-1]|uniref:CRISPR-associated helicase/endonuclease Cas3 n=1 Tax=Motiliproteus sp. MSK22-1 TaxID=1897630 RepID=UPI000976250E|nr:CRISPR-associated helicase/endonuclease Cas3 [Motiliproteus sp. MSK22-1]OMH30090.1 hypothetical protein BGP75_19360 [Motiliproteus sp. MSK22-1]
MVDQLFYRYWGKASPKGLDTPSYHLLPYHCLDVAAVGWQLLNPEQKRCQSLASQLGVDPQWLQQWFSFCLAMHDIGKFAIAFQGQVTGQTDYLVRRDNRYEYSERHDSLGYALWCELLCERWLARSSLDCSVRYLKPWLEIVTGHHGVPPKRVGLLDNFFTDQDKQAAEMFMEQVYSLLLAEIDLSPLIDKMLYKRIKAQSWQLSGVAVLADWLGSDQTHFCYRTQREGLCDYWKQRALPNAVQGLAASYQCRQSVAPFNNVQQLFPFIHHLTPLQQYALSVSLPKQPQLFMLEDVTGAGKTEAALILSHRLMSQELADGLYVGLPTMATANAMYRRLAKAYRALYVEEALPSLVLAHGACQHSKAFTDSIGMVGQSADSSYAGDEPSASAFCSAWLADNRKKALLADVGVGTLDQALLGVLPARHQSLRMLGLARKVLLVDEVHAYDSYMQSLLETLIEAQAGQGGSVILLSATLSQSMRSGLAAAYQRGLSQPENSLISQAYPLATRISADRLDEDFVETRKEVARKVAVERFDSEQDALDKVVNASAEGHCVCWVRNTVNDARRAFELLVQGGRIPAEKIMLFHSRFTMQDRQRIENRTLDLFGENSTVDERQGQVLIATQVVEQSLDLDFDLMISDLAPIDLLIQRAGRLHRHVRNVQGQRLKESCTDRREAPVMYILSPPPGMIEDEKWLARLLPGTAYVYPNTGQLWLTARLLGRKRGIAMPADARELIEGVYGSAAQSEIPDLLQDASFTARGEERTKRGMASLNVLKLKKGYCRQAAEDNSGWDEDVRIPTRLTEDNVAVALAIAADGELQPLALGEEYKGAKAWAMSTLNLSEKDWHQASKRIPNQWQAAIEQLKSDNVCLRWIEVLPLCGENADCYSSDGGWDL